MTKHNGRTIHSQGFLSQSHQWIAICRLSWWVKYKILVRSRIPSRVSVTHKRIYTYASTHLGSWALLNPAMKFVLGGSRSEPPKTNFIATISNTKRGLTKIDNFSLLLVLARHSADDSRAIPKTFYRMLRPYTGNYTLINPRSLTNGFGQFFWKRWFCMRFADTKPGLSEKLSTLWFVTLIVNVMKYVRWGGSALGRDVRWVGSPYFSLEGARGAIC